ncbi:Ig-like domain-containing protein [Pseudomonas sp. IzPS59]|uniref:Ig-like domain-containing protein n=1 Tax=Pseudomonas sp. IzPS59 TaxID=2774459 RepID=UPI001787E5E0|nr:Ig-like domain-containing protein [Pseudomonas sp. IzPS59]
MSINVNSTQISALLQLYPMAIPGAEENLQPPGAYHLGISESIYSPSTQLSMVIDPFMLFSTPSQAGDSVRLWVNSQATSVIKPINPGEENDRIFLKLPWGVLKNGLNTLYYEVTRVGSGNKDKSDPILNVLFNNPVSGITVSHPPSIGPGQPATFTLTRSYPREYDEGTLTMGTWSKTISYVHPANPISYTLTTTDLQQIGDGTHPVSARVIDQLTNSNVSATSSIVITANRPLIVPKLNFVLDENGNDVPQGGTTNSTSLTLQGEASPGRQVEIYDGSGPSAVPKGKATADPTTRKWVLSITVPSGARRLYAKSLYHPNNTYSNVRNLTVTPRLTIDKSLMLLAGNRIIQNYGWPQREIGTSIRTATGGVPPFNYISSNSSIVSVTESGKVTAHKPGVVTITVTDKNKDSASYSIDSQVMTFRHLVNNSPLTPSEARVWISGVGGMVASEFYRLNLHGIFEKNYTNILTIFDNASGLSTGRYVFHNDMQAGGVYIAHFSLLPSLVVGSTSIGYGRSDKYKAFALVRV